MYFLIITSGLLLAMRGARPAFLQRPLEGLKKIGSDALDLFLTASLILALGSFAGAFEMIQTGARDYAILGGGLAAYLLSRYQKKPDVFSLVALAIVFMIRSKPSVLAQEIFLAGVVSSGIAIFQACFLGLRHKLLFSRVPASMKGWPILCLLAGSISVALWSLKDLVF